MGMNVGKKGISAVIAAAVFLQGMAGGQVQGTLRYEKEQRLPARPIELSKVRLAGGPLKQAQDKDADYLLKLEPERMLVYYRRQAGLESKAAAYGGWDGGGRNLTGHIAGHYLSAVSLMWAATGDPRFKERADFIVKELKEVQDKHGDGYLSALEGGRECFEAVRRGQIRSGGFDLNGLWAPWYVLHKTYAGLRDAYRYTGNTTALEMEIKFAAWAERILADLTDEQVQTMLNTEFGGMEEVLADLYADTGDVRWLKLSRRFEHRSFTLPLQRHQDNLSGKHGNTQIPKMLGSLARFVYDGQAGDLLASAFFWDCVVQHHSYATGGHGKDEYFGDPDRLSSRIDGRTAETCNVYNMLKLTRRLFALRPDAHYVEFHERALFNHILASIDPEDGRTCYMVPVGQGVCHEYQDMFDSFTCCVGTGMESHALHADGIYYESENRLWVNLYAPSTVDWSAKGVRFTMETDFPDGESAVLTIQTEKPQEFVVALRRPAWAGEGFAAAVNGEPAANLPKPSSYAEFKRMWKDGDRIELTLPKRLSLEPTPDNPRRAAILWGPLVLAGDLGPERHRDSQDGSERIPVFAAAEQPVEQWLKPVEGEPGHFRTVGVGRDRDVDFVPFYKLHRRTYGIYWDLFTESEWQAKAAEYAAAQERRRKLELATVAYAQPGQMQPERDFNYQGAEDVRVERLRGRPCRTGGSWFSFDMPVEPEHPMTLVVTYFTGQWLRQPAVFDILADGYKIGTEKVVRRDPYEFYDVEYPIPPDIIKGKKKLTIRFEAAEGSRVAGVFGIRMIRADAAR